MHTHRHKIRPFSKTHWLKLAMERAEKKRNRLHLVKHTHVLKTRLFNETHYLMLEMEKEDKEKNR